MANYVCMEINLTGTKMEEVFNGGEEKVKGMLFEPYSSVVNRVLPVGLL